MHRCNLFKHVVFLMPQICMALSVTESYKVYQHVVVLTPHFTQTSQLVL
jgi:hypothetical protein